VYLPATDGRQAAERAGQAAPAEGRGVEAARYS
jgi:hypothetical protein